MASFGEEDAKTGMRDIPWKIEMDGALSWILHGSTDAFVPGIRDLLYGNPEHGIVSATERIRNGKVAIESLKQYKQLKASGDEAGAQAALETFRQYEKDFGYGYFDENNLGELVPNVPFLFWSFRYMVALGFFFALFFPLVWWRARQRVLDTKCRPLLKLALILIPLTYLGSELGWAVAEVGRQPWIVYEVLPTKIGVSAASATTVMMIFFGFLTVFTLLLIAALRIAINMIKEGPQIAEKEAKSRDDDTGETSVATPKKTPTRKPASTATTTKKAATTKPPAAKATTPAAKKAPVKSETTRKPTTRKAPTKKKIEE